MIYQAPKKIIVPRLGLAILGLQTYVAKKSTITGVLLFFTRSSKSFSSWILNDFADGIEVAIFLKPNIEGLETLLLSKLVFKNNLEACILFVD